MDVLPSHSLSDWLGVGDETIIVGLLDPLIDYSSGPDIVHLWSQNSSLIKEEAWAVSVASRLGKEDWDWVTLSHLVQSLVAGDFKGILRVAPLVSVQSEEVDSIIRVVPAGEVVLEHWTELGDVGGGIADWDLAHALGVAVCFHVASGCLDEWGNLGLVGASNNLIADEDTKSVGIVGESIEVGGKSIVLGGGPDSSLLCKC